MKYDKIEYMKLCLTYLEGERLSLSKHPIDSILCLKHVYTLYFRAKMNWGCKFCGKILHPSNSDQTCVSCWEVSTQLEDFLDSKAAFDFTAGIMGIEFECDDCCYKFGFSEACYIIGDQFKFISCPKCHSHEFSCVTIPNNKKEGD